MAIISLPPWGLLRQATIHGSEDVRTGALEARLAVMRPSGILNWRHEMSSAPNVVEKHIRVTVTVDEREA
jgi:hypothetical protein